MIQSDAKDVDRWEQTLDRVAGAATPTSLASGADSVIGIGGGPTRCTILPTDAKGRKEYPMATGLLDYFPDALAVVANVSWHGNQQHNPGQPLHWARGKSTDEADTLIRHFVQRGTRDVDGIRHSAKVVWRALAMLQKELEAEGKGVELPARRADDEPGCTANRYGYVCTVRKGHSGPHDPWYTDAPCASGSSGMSGSPRS